MCLYGILLGLVYLAVIIQNVSDCLTVELEIIDEKTESVRLKQTDMSAAEGQQVTDESGSLPGQVTS